MAYQVLAEVFGVDLFNYPTRFREERVIASNKLATDVDHCPTRRRHHRRLAGIFPAARVLVNDAKNRPLLRANPRHGVLRHPRFSVLAWLYSRLRHTPTRECSPVWAHYTTTGGHVNRRNAATVAAAGLVATLAPTPTLAQEERQEAKLHKVADAEMATSLLNTLANGGEGCGLCAFRIVAFSLTPNDSRYDLIVVTTGGLRDPAEFRR